MSGPTGRRVAVSGSGGLVGSALCRALEQRGDEVFRLVRRESDSEREIGWDPETGLRRPAEAEALDAFFHLAGENIAGGRWTARRRRMIHESRGPATERLVADLARLERPPGALLCASASGYYGSSNGARPLPETAPAGDDFLAGVCVAWEEAAQQAEGFARVVRTRFGVVLDPRGGILGRIVPLFRLGLGGRLGDGEQYFPWITLEDVVRSLLDLLDDEHASGPYNLCAPEAVNNQQFTRALGSSLSRPTWIPAPSLSLRLVLGEVADALLLASARMTPDRLRERDFVWRQPQLEPALDEFFD